MADGESRQVQALAARRGRPVTHPALVVMPRCKCGKWATYLGNYDEDGYTIRCKGCLRAIWKCRC